jgi:hypothetical protein
MKRFLLLILAVAGIFCLVPTKADAGVAVAVGGPGYYGPYYGPAYYPYWYGGWGWGRPYWGYWHGGWGWRGGRGWRGGWRGGWHGHWHR